MKPVDHMIPAPQKVTVTCAGNCVRKNIWIIFEYSAIL